MWKLVLLNCLFVQSAFSISIQRTNTREANRPLAVGFDSDTNSAYYVDYGADSTDYCLHRYDAGEKHTYSAYVKGPSLGSPGFMYPIKSSGPLRKFAVGFESFVGIVHWDGISHSAKLSDELFSVEDRLGDRERLSFGSRDPSGHSLYVGTTSLDFCVPSANQSVYVKQRGHGYRRVLTDLKYPGGWGFANGYVYIIDSCTLKVYAIPDSKCKGACGQAKVVFDFTTIGKKRGHFIPAGMDTGSDGILYIASYYDGCIYAIDPLHAKARVVATMPTGGITSVSFGGNNGDGQDFYVTVATKINDFYTTKRLPDQSPGTALYKVRGLGRGIGFKPYKA